jgi:succinate-semialdehyde dehydrogenase/glutarate-semialdehyde dehydrogenase
VSGWAPYPEIRLLIGGRWRDAARRRPVVDPATGDTLGSVPLADGRDLDDAVDAASAGLLAWSRTPPAERAAVLLRAAALLRDRTEAIAPDIVREQGKTLAGARGEIARGIGLLEWDAHEGRRLDGRVIPCGPGLHVTARREPVGVVAAFAPWNAPFSSPMRKICGALAAGCALVLKPAEETPAGAWHIARALQDAGLPPGALNLVFGQPEGVSTALIENPAVRLVTFTGSVAVGRQLAALAGQHLKPTIMELGGHAPVIVLADADIEAAARQGVQAKAVNSGQICVSPTRFFVERSVHERFTDAFVAAAEAVRVGPGLHPDSQMGPLANGRRVQAIDALVRDARDLGARVACGGVRPDGPGCFYPLSVLANVPPAARVWREEPFGPLAVIEPVDGIDDALARANALPLGLAAYAWTRSAALADAFATRVQAGALAINHYTASTAETPFGGVKDSGFGREGGIEGVQAFTVLKSVSHRLL